MQRVLRLLKRKISETLPYLNLLFSSFKRVGLAFILKWRDYPTLTLVLVWYSHIGVGTLQVGREAFDTRTRIFPGKFHIYLAAAHPKEINRLRCFVVINFHIACSFSSCTYSETVLILQSPEWACRDNVFSHRNVWFTGWAKNCNTFQQQFLMIGKRYELETLTSYRELFDKLFDIHVKKHVQKHRILNAI